MDSVLRGLYNGKVIPWERKEPHSKERLEVIRKIEDEERYFIQKMSLDDCQRFQALSNLHDQMIATEEENIFSYGFTLGVLLMLDVMKETETIRDE